METQEIIKANFEKFKTAKGLTIQKLADEKGVTRQTIYSYFREGIALRTIEKIASLVGVQPWELLKPDDAKDNKSTIICPHCQKPINLKITTE